VIPKGNGKVSLGNIGMGKVIIQRKIYKKKSPAFLGAGEVWPDGRVD